MDKRFRKAFLFLFYNCFSIISFFIPNPTGHSDGNTASPCRGGNAVSVRRLPPAQLPHTGTHGDRRRGECPATTPAPAREHRRKAVQHGIRLPMGKKHHSSAGDFLFGFGAAALVPHPKVAAGLNGGSDSFCDTAAARSHGGRASKGRTSGGAAMPHLMHQIEQSIHRDRT